MAVRDRGGHRRDGGRGVPRAGRADADRSARRHRPGRAPAIASVLLWDQQRDQLRRRRRPTTSACSSPGCSSSSACCRWRSPAPTIERERLPRGEYYALMLFAIAGMMLMAMATDLLVIFLALEVLSLAVYVLTGHPARLGRRHRGGVQVFPARRVLERVLPLRHRVHLRRDRQHAARSDRQR